MAEGQKYRLHAAAIGPDPVRRAQVEVDPRVYAALADVAIAVAGLCSNNLVPVPPKGVGNPGAGRPHFGNARQTPSRRFIQNRPARA
jgi:hypothetical protein